MPDNRSKRPLPAVMDVGTFRERFGTDEACWEHLRNVRWGPDLERFTCPDCGHGKGWWLANRRLVECCECHHQRSRGGPDLPLDSHVHWEHEADDPGDAPLGLP